LTVVDIVEKVTEEQQKELQPGEYIIANNDNYNYNNIADNDNGNYNNNNIAKTDNYNNLETDMFSNDNDNDVNSHSIDHYEDRSNNEHQPHQVLQPTSVGGGDGQAWWASRIESVVNGNKYTGDDAKQWPQIRNSDVMNEDAVKISPSNEDGVNLEQHGSWSAASGHDWMPEMGHMARYDSGQELNAASSHHTWVQHDAVDDRTGGQRSLEDYKDYRSVADGNDQDQRSQPEPAVEQLMQPNSLNDYYTKDGESQSSDNSAC
jgi:hypothetical protein